LESSRSILVKVFTEYYHSATQAKDDGRPVAYITAFTPVEILRAMGITCVYPESYAVVCAASNKSTDLIQASGMEAFSQDLCSYSLLSFGADHYEKLPFRGLPQPDMLIATNNQCGTTMLWFRLLAQKKNIPLFILDYPAAVNGQPALTTYIERQYEVLVDFVKVHTGNDLNTSILNEQIERSRRTCYLWKRIHEVNKANPARIEAHKIVDALFPIVVAKGTQQAYDYYGALLGEYSQTTDRGTADAVRLLWHGYPIWFLPKKFPCGFDDAVQVNLNDYTLWWSLNYPDDSGDMETLAAAYSDTYLNRPIQRKVGEVADLIADYSIDGVICHVNRSCRRALADIVPLRKKLHQLSVPSVTIESDMANPGFYSDEQVKLRIESFCDALRVS
jgi:benzoyl-CoA reductase/2-hydroxyglutaryl-CoA dehydratase subunit BcrC/BadD/HgdB